MNEDKILLITIAIERSSGKLTNASNVDAGDLPLVYRALRAVENQIFEDISHMLTPPQGPNDGYKVPVEENSNGDTA